MKTIDLTKPITNAEQAAAFMEALGGNVIFATGRENGTPYVFATTANDRSEGNAGNAPMMVTAVEKLRARLAVKNEANIKRLEAIKADAEERLAATKKGLLVLDSFDL